MSVDRGDIALLTAPWPRKPASWLEFERCIAAVAEAHGQNPTKAVADLNRNGPLVRLLCAQLGFEKPQKKRGRKTRTGINDLTLAITDDLKRQGFKGERLQQLRHEALTSDTSVFHDLHVEPTSIAQRTYRARRKAKP